MRFGRGIATVFVLCAILIGGSVLAEELTLNDCIDRALENHPDIYRAKGNAKVAGEGVWTAVGQFLPSISGSGRVSESRGQYLELVDPDDPSQGFRAVEGFNKSYSAGLSASITAFNGGQNLFDYFQAKANKSYYNYLEKQSRQNLILTVKNYYFAYLAAQRMLEIRTEALKRGEEQLKLAESKYEVGSASKSDVLKARVQFGNDKLDLITAENDVRTTFADLTWLIGVDVNSDVTFSKEYQSEHYDGSESDALSFGMNNQPSLLAAEKSMTAAKWGVWSARGQYLPTITVSVSRDYQNDRYSQLAKFRNLDRSTSISTSLRIPIFTGFSRKAAVSRAKVSLNNSRAEFYYARNELALEIKKAYLSMNEAKEKLSVAEETVTSADEDMALVREKYNLGAATILELLDAEVSLITAQNNKIQAEFDYNLAVAALEKAMGISK